MEEREEGRKEERVYIEGREDGRKEEKTGGRKSVDGRKKKCRWKEGRKEKCVWKEGKEGRKVSGRSSQSAGLGYANKINRNELLAVVTRRKLFILFIYLFFIPSILQYFFKLSMISYIKIKK